MSPPFPTVPVTVDAIIELGPNEIVLIERRDEPYGWAIPGGFVEPGESLYQAVRREAKEETGLDIHVCEQFHTYSKPGRDPRGPVASVVFICMADGTPKAGDDAKACHVVGLKHLVPRECAFDHEDVLTDYLHFRLTGRRPGAMR